MEFIRKFSNISKSDAKIAGGKGASLGEMISKKLPVPPGFVILSMAFHKFLKYNKLSEEISRLLNSIDHNKISSLEEASKRIRKIINISEIPAEIENEIEENFKKLGAKLVAVRSSATAEDGSVASWAGQLDTFLNTDKNNLMKNIKKCWASLFTPRAIFYRFEKNMSKQKISVAVIVQKMVNSKASGIAFSVHPVTQNRNNMLIEVGSGLGESVVSGKITPDSYTIEKSSLKIVSKKLQDKNGLLSEKTILDLSKLILKIESHYKFPVDVEWAVENKKIYILQSRPITTQGNSKQAPSVLQTANSVRKWLVMNSSLYPYIVAIGMKQWTNISCKRYPELNFEKFCGARFLHGGKEGQYIADEEEYFNSAKTLFENVNWLKKYFMDFKNDEVKFKKFVNDVNKNGYKFLFGNFQKFLEVYDNVFSSGFTIDGFLIFGDSFAEKMKSRYPNYEKEIFTLTRIYGESFVENQKKDLIKIAIKIKNLKREFKSEESLLKDQMLAKMLEAHQKTYHFILNNYKNVEALPVSYFAKELLSLLSQSKDNLKKELERMNSAIKNHRKDCSDIYKRKIFSEEDCQKLLWIGKIAWWIDRRKECNLIANHFIGAYLKWICGKNMLEYEDVVFLTPSELELVLSKKEKIAHFPIKDRRKESILFYDKYNNELFLTGGEAKVFWKKIDSEKISGSDEIFGQVASQGKVSGLARIVKNPRIETMFKEGEILVTGMTRPDFVPLMKKAAAIITDEGGITSHAAIISRELKKPCIIGTKVATKILKTGDLIEVDANSGIVRILKKNS